MSNKTRYILKTIAAILVLLGVAIRLDWVSIPAINSYNFWMVVIAFGLMLFASK
jgi:hypothetical protein